MPNETPKLYFVLQSRKFWSAVVGFAAIIYVAWHSGAALDPDTVVNAILGIVAAYMGSTALEDGMSNRNANKTTISTPGSSDVSVISGDSAPSAPDKPIPPATPHVPPTKPPIGTTGMQ